MTFGTSHSKRRCIIISAILSLHPLIRSPPENLCPEQQIHPNPYYIWTYNKPKPAALISNQDSYKKIQFYPKKWTDRIPWAFLMSQEQADAVGLLSSVEYGTTAFSDAGEDRLYKVHELEEKLEDAPSALHVSGSAESYIQEGTTLSQSSVGCWAMEYHKPATTNTHFKTAQGFLYLPAPLQTQEVAAAAFSMWTGKQSLQSTVLLQSWKHLKTLVVVVQCYCLQHARMFWILDKWQSFLSSMRKGWGCFTGLERDISDTLMLSLPIFVCLTGNLTADVAVKLCVAQICVF